MTPTIDTGKRVTMLATIGGIGAVVTLLVASHVTGRTFELTIAPDFEGLKKLWVFATAGVFWAAIFNWLFEKWIWRISLLQGWLTKVPDLSGIWKGRSESRFFKDKNGQYCAIDLEATIDHRFDRIIYTQSAKSHTIALAADLSTDENGFCRLTVTYENLAQPTALRQGGVAECDANTRPHFGCALMTLHRLPKGNKKTAAWTLQGFYWTDKARVAGSDDRGTTGVMELHWDHPL